MSDKYTLLRACQRGQHCACLDRKIAPNSDLIFVREKDKVAGCKGKQYEGQMNRVKADGKK